MSLSGPILAENFSGALNLFKDLARKSDLDDNTEIPAVSVSFDYNFEKERYIQTNSYVGSLYLYQTAKFGNLSDVVDDDYYESEFSVNISWENGVISGTAMYKDGYLGTISDEIPTLADNAIFSISGEYADGLYTMILKNDKDTRSLRSLKKEKL